MGASEQCGRVLACVQLGKVYRQRVRFGAGYIRAERAVYILFWSAIILLLSAHSGTVVEGVLPTPNYGVRWRHFVGRDGVVGVVVVH